MTKLNKTIKIKRSKNPNPKIKNQKIPKSKKSQNQIYYMKIKLSSANL
jgi:hypothetical protein